MGLLHSGQSRLVGADRPARIRRELFQRLVGSLVERTDVPELDRPPLAVAIHPAQRQSLCAADVGTIVVDPAGTFLVEKGAAPDRMGGSGPQQGRVRPADALGLDLEDREIVDATAVAAARADEPLTMLPGQSFGPPVDLGV